MGKDVRQLDVAFLTAYVDHESGCIQPEQLHILLLHERHAYRQCGISVDGLEALAEFYKSTILDDMRMLRVSVDEMEMIASADKWPYPSYGELLFGVR